MRRKIIAGILIIIILISSASVQCIIADDAVTNNDEVTYINIRNIVGNSDVVEHQFMIKNGVIYVDYEWIRDNLGLVVYMDQSTLEDRLSDAKEDNIKAVAKEYKETFAEANSDTEFKISKEESELIFYFREGCKYAFAISKYFGVYKVDIGESVVAENGFWFPLVGILDLFDSYCYIRDDILIVGEPSTTVVDILHSRMFDGYYYDIISDYGENKLIFGAKHHYYDFYSRLKNYVQGALKFDTLQMRNALTYDELSDFLTLQICTFNTEEAEKYREGISSVSLLADLVGVTVDGYGEVATKVADGAIQRSSELNNALEQVLKDPTGFNEADDYFKALNKAVDATQKSDTASRILDKIDFASEILTHSLSFINAYTVYLSAIYEMNHTNYDAVSALEVFLKHYRKSTIYQEYNIGADGIDKKIDLYKHGDSLFENDELFDRVAEKFGTSEIAAISYSELYDKFPGTFKEVFPVLLVTTIGWDLLEGRVNKLTNGSYDHLESALQMQYAMDFEKVTELIVHDYKNRMVSEHTYDLDEYRKLEWMRLKSYYLARETMLMYSSKFVKKHPEEMEKVVKIVQEEEDKLLEHMGVLLSGIHMGRMPSDYEDNESKITTTNNKVVSELVDLYSENESEKYEEENQTNTNDVIDKYKNFISAQNELLFYSIYDIDKDGYPELFFYENHPQERESFCDIYSYSGGEFKLIERTHGPGFWHVLPTYASYPNGNGIVEHGAVKGYEFVDVHTLNDGILNTEEVYYSKEGAKYYLDSDDQAYYESQYNNPINHQYYQSETSSPYFEGSYLLGSNAKDNFTALYEAFDFIEGMNSETSDVEVDAEERWMLVKTVLEGVDGNKVGLSSSDEIVTEYLYDENHNCIEEKESHDGSSFVITNTYGYDDEGHMIYMETPTGGPYLYTYNDMGQEIQCEDAGEIYTSTYDDHGNIVQRDHYRNGSIYHFIRYTYDYDDEGNAVEKQCVDDDGIVWIQKCEYDKNNNLIKVEHYARGEEYSWMEKYEYDDASRKTAEFHYSKVNEIVGHHTFEYDQFGNLVKDYDIRDGQVYSIKTYYYEQY